MVPKIVRLFIASHMQYFPLVFGNGLSDFNHIVFNEILNKKSLWLLLMDGDQLPQGYRATFYH